MTIKALRTPEERFADIPDFDYPVGYLDDLPGYEGLRIAYVDAGPKHADHTFLCLHGEPSWSFLYRRMIPAFLESGARVIAPDLLGFGRSDKPVEQSDYSFHFHRNYLLELVRRLDLKNITIVCQDWGGLIGLRLLAEMPDRFARVVTANTALPTGDQPMGAAFESWREFSQQSPEFRTGRIVYGGTETKLSEEEVAAYDAPFPDETFKEGARQFPMLVPARPDDPASDPNRAAWSVLKTLNMPFLTAFGSEDKVMAGVDAVLQRLIPGAQGQPHVVLPGAGHFLQEDVGDQLADLTCDFIDATT